MALWDWALEVYAQPGVAAAALDLQDGHGQNVPYLLWAVWAETTDAALLARAATVAQAWETRVVGPLRDLRRALKVPAPPIAEGARLALRDEVKAVELRAERVLMETLETLAGDHRGGAPALQALRAASQAWEPTAPDMALAALAAAFD